jgi:hypothetical protein
MLRRLTRAAIAVPTSAACWKRIATLADEKTMYRLLLHLFTRHKPRLELN